LIDNPINIESIEFPARVRDYVTVVVAKGGLIYLICHPKNGNRKTIQYVGIPFPDRH